MTDNELKENEFSMIARFMGTSLYGFHKTHFNRLRKLFPPEELHLADDLGYSIECPYKSSWDNLIPVIAKIKTLNRFGSSEYLSIMATTLEMMVTNGITSTYSKVIAFLQWYNQNK